MQLRKTVLIINLALLVFNHISFVNIAGNDLLEDSPYEPMNSRLSDIFRLAPIYAGMCLFNKDAV